MTRSAPATDPARRAVSWARESLRARRPRRATRTDDGPARPRPQAEQLSNHDQLWNLVQAEQWPGERPTRGFFDLVVRAVGHTAREGKGKLLIAADQQADLFERVLGAQWPALAIAVARSTDDLSEQHARLSSAAPFDVVVQAADGIGSTQARMFRRTFMHLRAGGIYLTPRIVSVTPAAGDEGGRRQPPPRWPLPNEDEVVEAEYDGDLWTLVNEALAARLIDFTDHTDGTVPFRDIRGLGRHLGEVHLYSKMLWIKNQLRTQPKLTEREADAVLAAHLELGAEICSRPPASLTAGAGYLHNLGEDLYYRPVMQAPKITLRRYVRPVCSRGQIVTSGGFLWPDTFRHHLYPRLTNTYVEESAPLFGYVRRDISDPVELPGSWFHLDSEWPGHFGHLLTEQLGRLWAWDEARRHDPDIKVLLTVQHDRSTTRLHSFETELLETFGITADRVHVFDRPCRPEVLYSATSMFSAADYVHPELTSLWRSVGDTLAAQATGGPWPERIFCTRRPGLKRECRNTGEVEAMFRRHGFDIVHPDELSLPDQVAMFRSASAVAGFAGSALFTLAFCPQPKPVFLLGPTTYTARNEHLICAANAHPLVAAWSPADIDHPEGGWKQAAFGSDYTFDLGGPGAFLERQLDAQLGR